MRPPRKPTVRTKSRKEWWFDPEGTVIAEFDPDGLPLGMVGPSALHKIPDEGESPRFVIVALWAILLSLTVYAARDLRGMVVHSESLSSSRVLVAVADGFYAVAKFLGPARLHDAIADGLAPLKQRDLVGDVAWAQGDVEAQTGRPTPGGDAGTQVGQGKQLRVLLVGASSMQYYLGAELERRLEQYQNVVSHRFGKLGTGLARPDEFDWGKQLPQLVEAFRPNLVIGQFGGNDGQPLRLADGTLAQLGTDAWSEEYTRRVQEMIQIAQKAGAKVVMLGMPITKHKKHSQRLERVNAVTQRATEDAGAVYIATWDIAEDANGAVRETITHAGKTGPMYLADGVHYGRVGASFVAEKLAWRLERLFDLVPKDEQLAVAVRRDLLSSVRGKTTSFLAFMPHAAFRGEAQLPVLYLLHGAGGSWTDFSEKGHDLVRRLAAKEQLVIVAPDGDTDGWYVDSPKVEGAKLESYLMKELLPHVEKHLPVTERRSIGGISMGGNGAIVLALKYPGTFVSVSSMSGAVDLSEAANRPALVERLGPYEENSALWERSSALHLVEARAEVARELPLLLTVGSQDRWAPASRALKKMLEALGSTAVLKESPGDHGWGHWLSVLPEHVAWHARHLHAKE